MNILDFEESGSEFFEYETVQRVWGKDTEISVTFENKELKKGVDEDEVSLRGIVRLLSAKLRFVEENRSEVEKTILAANIEGLTENDISSLDVNWALFIYYADIAECELFLYLEPKTDVLDGAEIAVTVHNDNALTFDEIVDA